MKKFFREHNLILKNTAFTIIPVIIFPLVENIPIFNYVRQLESEPFADLILSHPVMARK